MKSISAQAAPQAIGPYSQAVDIGSIVFLSGVLPLDPEKMELVEDEVQVQTEQVLSNMKAVLAEAGLSLSNVAKTTVFLKDMADFAGMNEIYAKHFGEHKPARSTVQVAKCPLDARVEIECVAVK